MEQNMLPSNPAQITKELVKASFNVEITRLDYHKILQSAADIIWTRENIDQPLLAPAEYVAKKITEKKERDKRPFIDAGKVIQNEYNSIFNPLNDIISQKIEEKKKLIRVMQLEEEREQAEKSRISSIENGIITFIHSVTNEITQAEDDSTIVLVEKRIGSESKRENFYQEFLPKLKQQCAELKPLIVKQKEYIRKMQLLKKQQSEAELKGNDSKAVELRQKAEELKEVIEESKIMIQQKAFEQIESSNSLVVGESTIASPKATRSWWKWRVDDIHKLSKKCPELVEYIPNKAKIDELLAQKRESGELDGQKEININGLVFYLEQNF